MYINFNYAKELEITPTEIILLQAIKQLKNEDGVLDVIKTLISRPTYEKMLSGGYIEFIKGREGQEKLAKIRLSKKGSDLLDKIETPEISVGDDRMFDYLCEMYLAHEDKERTIGNKKKTRMYCAQFRIINNLSLHEMYWLCQYFLSEYPYTKRLEYIFFNSNKNRYGTFKNNIDDSPLYQFLNERKDDVEFIWKQKIKN